MMIGIGTPRKRSNTERILNPQVTRMVHEAQIGLGQLHMISLPTSERGRKARAKRADQQSHEYPQ